MKKNKFASKILKWVGGKQFLLFEIEKYIPKNIKTYYEPFFGGGAVLFNLQPKSAVINDINSELINMYQIVKDDVDSLIENLKIHQNTEEYFYKLRELDRNKEKYDNLTKVERASRLIYLNKTCYNGLFRVNQSGEFNSPFGYYKNPNIVNEVGLKAVSDLFNKINIEILNEDFAKAVSGASKGDFVYLDPPYDPISSSSSFTGYDKGGFDRSQQIRLKEVCDDLNKRGVKFLLSNSKTDFILDLYKDYKIEIVKAKRSINSKGDLRGEVDEVLVRNYD